MSFPDISIPKEAETEASREEEELRATGTHVNAKNAARMNLRFIFFA